MREELLGPKVENVAVAVVQQLSETQEKIYNVYLLNLRDDIMEGIIITSSGFSFDPESGEKIKTSTLRHCMELMLPDEAAKIEPIMEEVFGMTNEYMVSFWVNDVMHDKKFSFLPNTIREENFEDIPFLNARGILIR